MTVRLSTLAVAALIGFAATPSVAQVSRSTPGQPEARIARIDAD